MQVNFYYDFSEQLTQDTEGNLVMLCQDHVKQAKQEGHEIEWASSGDEECICEWEGCETNNNPIWYDDSYNVGDRPRLWNDPRYYHQEY